MTTYREFQEALQALHRQSEATRRIEKAAAIDRIRAWIVEYRLRPDDLGFGPGEATVPGSPKYRDPVSGATWSGRGRMPKWLAGQDRARFAILQPAG